MKEKNTSEARISIEGYMLKNGREGSSFFTDKADKSMTAFAKYYNKKIKANV